MNGEKTMSILTRLHSDFVISVQMDPPTPKDHPCLLQRVDECWVHGAGAVDINTSKLVPSADSLVMAQLLLSSSHPIGEVIPHVAVRDNGVTGLVNRVYGLYRYAGRSILVIKGDAYKDGQGTGCDDDCGLTSVKVIRVLNRELKLSGACPHLVIGAAFNQNNDCEKEWRKAILKKRAGARFFMSQPVFSRAQLRDLAARFNSLGTLMVGLFPLPYQKVFRLVQSGGIPGVVLPPEMIGRAESGDDELEKWTLDLNLDLLQTARRLWSGNTGIRGVYIVAPRGRPRIVVKLLQEYARRSASPV